MSAQIHLIIIYTFTRCQSRLLTVELDHSDIRTFDFTVENVNQVNDDEEITNDTVRTTVSMVSLGRADTMKFGSDTKVTMVEPESTCCVMCV
jgi:hypothetical protein